MKGAWELHAALKTVVENHCSKSSMQVNPETGKFVLRMSAPLCRPMLRCTSRE